ncbi:hypothetical protein UY3_16520 [Chelonia mydas]|uniref:Myb/SANT-like DNA-binding domain-containing protein n=1 Tax=Chelonia mydas TaxID=8469 RepID=M7AMG7_CHEMY|nr:hypothetical protein UY3_16520 [Chelonia mydas]
MELYSTEDPEEVLGRRTDQYPEELLGLPLAMYTRKTEEPEEMDPGGIVGSSPGTLDVSLVVLPELELALEQEQDILGPEELSGVPPEEQPAVEPAKDTEGTGAAPVPELGPQSAAATFQPPGFAGSSTEVRVAIPYHAILTSALLLAVALPSELGSLLAATSLQLSRSEGSAATCSSVEVKPHALAWSRLEILDLLGLWGEEAVQAQLRTSIDIYNQSALEIQENGYDRDPQQCCVKVKELWQAYQKAREANS